LWNYDKQYSNLETFFVDILYMIEIFLKQLFEALVILTVYVYVQQDALDTGRILYIGVVFAVLLTVLTYYNDQYATLFRNAILMATTTILLQKSLTR
jgi:hypothetical protein